MVIEEPLFEENEGGEGMHQRNLEKKLEENSRNFIDDALKIRGFELERAIDEKLERILAESREVVKDSKTFYESVSSILGEILTEVGAGELQIIDRTVEHVREHNLLGHYLSVGERLKLFFFTLFNMKDRAGEMYRGVAREFLDDSIGKMDEFLQALSRRIYSQRDNLKTLEGEMESIKGEMKKLVKEFAEINRDYYSLRKIYDQQKTHGEKGRSLTIADILKSDHVSTLRTKGSLTELEFLYRSAYNKLVGLENRYARLAIEHSLNLQVLHTLLKVYEETRTRKERYMQLLNNRTSITSIQDLYGLLQRYKGPLTSLEEIFSGYDVSKIDVEKFGKRLGELSETSLEEISQEDLYITAGSTEAIDSLIEKTRKLLGADPSQLLEEFSEGGENDESQ